MSCIKCVKYIKWQSYFLLLITCFLFGCLTDEEREELKYKLVTVETLSETSKSYNSIVCGGRVVAPQARKIERGVCWSAENTNPAIDNSSFSIDGTEIGDFTSTITGLLPNKLYYIRAYANSAYGAVYGKTIAVKTLSAVVPLVTTSTLSAIGVNSVVSGGNVTSDGGSEVIARGVCWATTPMPTTSSLKTVNGGGVGLFVSSVVGLQSGVTYYLRAYAINSAGTAYGAQIEFKTQSSLPVLSTVAASSITATGAISGGNITSDGGASVTARGVCWSNTTTTPTTSHNSVNSGTGVGSYNSSITGLSPNTTYYVRAYASNSVGTAYGTAQSFRTNSASLPILSTTSISTITTNSAISGGNITSDGGASVTARGVCWSSSTTSPTTSHSKVSNGTGVGAYSSSITGLAPNTTYYVRAYATNSVGTAYGTAQSFRTNSVSLPILSTTTISSITTNSAISGGNISSDGGASVTARGVCWSNATTTPTTSHSSVNNGTGVGSYNSSVTGLLPNTTYYVRAYATNSAGTAYGTAQSFRTNSASLPIVSTTTISSITTNSAISGGTISSDGGASVTARGVCWSDATTTPTTSHSSVNNGTGVGSYNSSVTGLLPNTTYYVRAYATNSAGTAYGTAQSFRTNSASLPIISTTTISSITLNSAISGGTISSDGGAMVTSRGVCWSSSTSSPTTSNSNVSNGTGVGTYSSSITGLAPNTVYYLRAFATNSAGTAYGTVRSFRTNTLVIGDNYQGGVIFYIDNTGAKGLVCAPTDQSTSVRWFNGTSNMTTYATNSSIGSGKSNTNSIVLYQGTGTYAASICNNLILNGYSDWFLPSRNELDLMYNNLKRSNKGGFSNSYYWSSTEHSGTTAIVINFNDGLHYYTSKNSLYSVRAVRAF